MGAFKKYVTCIMAFLTPFNYLPHFVNFTLTLPLCCSLNFTKNRIWLLHLIMYIKGCKKSLFETQLNF